MKSVNKFVEDNLFKSESEPLDENIKLYYIASEFIINGEFKNYYMIIGCDEEEAIRYEDIQNEAVHNDYFDSDVKYINSWHHAVENVGSYRVKLDEIN